MAGEDAARQEVQACVQGSENDPTLDKTRTALEGLKQGMPGDLLVQVEKGFHADLNELGITDPGKRLEYWGQLQRGIQERMAQGTEQYQAIVAYTRNLDNLPELKGVIESKNPKGKIRQCIEKVAEKYKGATAMIALFLAEWAADEEEAKGKKTMGTRLARKLAAWLEGKSEPQEPQAPPAAPVAATPGARPAPTPEVPPEPIPADAAGVRAFLTALQIQDSDPKTQKHYARLKQLYPKSEKLNELAEGAANETSGVRNLYKTINDNALAKGETLNSVLWDVRLEDIDPAKMELVKTQLSRADHNAKATAVRGFLDEIPINNVSETALESLAKKHKLVT